MPGSQSLVRRLVRLHRKEWLGVYGCTRRHEGEWKLLMRAAIPHQSIASRWVIVRTWSVWLISAQQLNFNKMVLQCLKSTPRSPELNSKERPPDVGRQWTRYAARREDRRQTR